MTLSVSVPPVPERCPEEALKTIYGEYLWPKTLPQSEQVMICEEPAFRRAYRFCKLDFNDTAIWAQPNMTACKPLMIITDLDNVTVTADNAAEVVQMIKDLINLELGTANGGDGDLSASDMVTVVEKLENVVDVAIVTPILCNEIVSMISDMLISKSDMNSVANIFCSTVHVDVSPEKSVERVQAYITERLTATTFSYDSLTLMTDTDSLSIQPVVPERCPEEALKTIYGEYLWPKTLPQSEQVMICEEPAFRRAYRFCKLDFNDTAIWAQPNMTACKPLMIITDLDNVTVTADNAAEVVQMIKDLINLELGTANGGDGDLSASDMVTVVEKLENVVDVAIVTPILSTPALALSMNNVQSENFTGMTFSVSSYSSGTAPEIVVNRSFVDAVPGTVATIALPPELRNLLDTDIMDGAEGNWTLNSYVISASINNGMVRNLKPQRVAVTLGNDIAKQEDDKLMCVFWDFSENDGQGGWNSQGCETQVISAHQTSCLCDHLTSFAVLLNISRAPVSEKDSEILTVISYLGCGISSSFLGITLITYMAFGKLRRDYPSKILINLSVALLALNLLYLLNTWLSSFGSYGLCIATAALLHYSLLASFTWMGLEALNMYFALVRVFNVYVPSYILKFCAVGWGVPLVIVGLVLATDVDAYGNSMSVGEDTSEPFCWIQSDVHFYVTVAAFIMLILLGNVGVFVVVLIQIRRMQANKPGLGKPGSGSSMQDLRAAASLTFLLGLTWLIAFLSFGPGRVAMLYLFCIFNSLQGFFIFLFHCLLKENVRKQWIMHLTVKRKDSSEWSLSFTASGQPKQRQEGHSHSMRSMVEVSSTMVEVSSTMVEVSSTMDRSECEWIKVSDSSSSTESGPDQPRPTTERPKTSGLPTGPGGTMACGGHHDTLNVVSK
ncbi:hypothetical protein NHX12_000642 [Muraenolepis orangiensis]|uniref:Adhesion G-protein coupled receptor G4-like n=1 Tax=Muraenolepis orangiensis TaxID=630683 RepID=A0A9Q0II10_9TELE|nr:hypothetical protein NHX12_000642 [Muraenolepis orangiensis]